MIENVNERTPYELAYDEAVRALSQQQSVLDNFRTRAGILLSGAAIATSFLGGQALRSDALNSWSWSDVHRVGGPTAAAGDLPRSRVTHGGQL